MRAVAGGARKGSSLLPFLLFDSKSNNVIMSPCENSPKMKRRIVELITTATKIVISVTVGSGVPSIQTKPGRSVFERMRNALWTELKIEGSGRPICVNGQKTIGIKFASSRAATIFAWFTVSVARLSSWAVENVFTAVFRTPALFKLTMLTEAGVKIGYEKPTYDRITSVSFPSGLLVAIKFCVPTAITSKNILMES